MTLQEFYDKCATHDWFYEYSDDGSVWRRGSAAESELRRLAKTSPQHQDLYDKWRAHVFSGPIFGKEKQPMPERPA